jgi:hypothetical protein
MVRVQRTHLWMDISNRKLLGRPDESQGRAGSSVNVSRNAKHSSPHLTGWYPRVADTLMWPIKSAAGLQGLVVALE